MKEKLEIPPLQLALDFGVQGLLPNEPTRAVYYMVHNSLIWKVTCTPLCQAEPKRKRARKQHP